MKTSKTFKIKKSEKQSGTGKNKKHKEVPEPDFLPSDDGIREKAMEIYLQRVERDETGTPEDDWSTAEKYFRSEGD